MINLSATVSFTRPADTTAYASGDLVANSTTAASVAALQFKFPRQRDKALQIKRVNIQKSDASDIANAAFRLHLFRNIPTFATNGDNDPISGNTSGATDWIGSLDVTAMIALADDAVGQGIPVSGTEVIWQNINAADSADNDTLYGILEARGAYSPASAEVFTVTIFGVPVVGNGL